MGKFTTAGMAVYIVGNMIGTGTHQTLKKLAQDGCGNLLWANFFIAGLLVTISSLPLFHLYDKFPVNDCLHQAASKGLGKSLGQFASYVNGQLITIELTFAVAMQTSFFGDGVANLLADDAPAWTTHVVSLGLLAILFFVYRTTGALFTANLAWALGVIELTTVGLLVFSSPLSLLAGSTLGPANVLLDPSKTSLAKFPLGIHVAIFAYGGFPGMLQAGDLVESPRESLPRSIVSACVITMCIYSLMSASVLLVVEPEAIALFKNGFDSLKSAMPDRVIALVSCTVLSSVANNIMENTLVIIENLQQMTKANEGNSKLALPNVGLFDNDVVTFGIIATLTLFKNVITLGVLGDAIDFALILQFTIFALLSIANNDGQHLFSYHFFVSMVSLAANSLVGLWHLCNASSLPMIILCILVFFPLVPALGAWKAKAA